MRWRKQAAPRARVTSNVFIFILRRQRQENSTYIWKCFPLCFLDFCPRLLGLHCVARLETNRQENGAEGAWVKCYVIAPRWTAPTVILWIPTHPICSTTTLPHCFSPSFSSLLTLQAIPFQITGLLLKDSVVTLSFLSSLTDIISFCLIWTCLLYHCRCFIRFHCSLCGANGLYILNIRSLDVYILVVHNLVTVPQNGLLYCFLATR